MALTEQARRVAALRTLQQCALEMAAGAGWCCLLCWVWLTAGCKPNNSRPIESSLVLQVTTYEARGTIRRINLPARAVVIAHDAIPGYMEAMAMEFDAADARELEPLQPGDVITFRLYVDPARSWIDQLHKVGTAPLAFAAPEAEASFPANALAPDCALADSAGRAFHVADYRGQVLVIGFIFTRCPLPDFCPRLSTRFSELPAALAGAGDGWHMLTVSFDPEYDTPERLAAYAKRFGADPAQWTFATGEENAVREFGAAFGLSVKRTSAGFEHNLRTVVVDPAGRVRRVFAGNAWTTAELASEVRRAMGTP